MWKDGIIIPSLTTKVIYNKNKPLSITYLEAKQKSNDSFCSGAIFIAGLCKPGPSYVNNSRTKWRHRLRDKRHNYINNASMILISVGSGNGLVTPSHYLSKNYLSRVYLKFLSVNNITLTFPNGQWVNGRPLCPELIRRCLAPASSRSGAWVRLHAKPSMD